MSTTVPPPPAASSDIGETNGSTTKVLNDEEARRDQDEVATEKTLAGVTSEPDTSGEQETKAAKISAEKVASRDTSNNSENSAEARRLVSSPPTPPPPPPPPPPLPLPPSLPKLIIRNNGNSTAKLPSSVHGTDNGTGRPLSAPPMAVEKSHYLKLDVQTRRKSSTVSFKDVCELFEIDLEALNSSGQPPKPAAVFSLRYYVMILALVSPFIVTYSRTIINFAIIDMIDPNYLIAHQQQQQHSQHHRPSLPPEATTIVPQLPQTLEATTHATDSTTLIAEESSASPAVGLESLLVTPPPPLPDAKLSTSYFDVDNSCPVDENTRHRLEDDLTMDTIRARQNAGEKFEWDTVKQGLLKAAYAIGHMLLQVVGGRLSELYGTHLITSVSSCLIGLCCLLAPFFASAHFYLLFADLFVLGVLGSFMTPALITLFSNWLTPSEKSMMMSLYLVSSRLGYALSSLLCGLLISAHLSWRYLFYSAGWLTMTFSVLFVICVRSRPHEHPLISQEELDYLASKNTLVREAISSANSAKVKVSTGTGSGSIQMTTIKKKKASNGASSGDVAANGQLKSEMDASKTGVTLTSSQGPLKDKEATATATATVGAGAGAAAKTRPKPGGAPWLAILTNVPVWAFIVTKFCVKLAGDTVQIELPTYLKRVMHLTPKHNGFVNASNYVIFCISCLLVGLLAKSANKRRPFGWTKTTVRKVFQVTASFGASLALLGMSLSVCHETATLVLLMLMFFFTTFSTGGEAQIPLDISERYAGTIHAIGSSLAISGIIEPILVGFILREHPADRDRWSGVWMGASGVAFLGGLVFMLFGDATIQSFDSLDQQQTASACLSSGRTVELPSCKAVAAAKLAELKGLENETFERGDDEGAEIKLEAPPFRESAEI